MNTKRLESARELDLRLKEIVGKARRAEAELAKALLEMKRWGLFRYLSYPRVEDYAEAELDLRAGKTKDLIEIAAKLEGLPRVRAAFEAGALAWTKARQVVRVATAADEDAWLERAQALSNRALERAVAAAKGERPVVRVVLELSEADAADLDEAVRRLREERAEAVPLGEAVAELCRRAWGPPVERPGWQVVVHECPTCGEASRDARGGPIAVPRDELAAAKADADVLDLRDGGKGKLRRAISPAERRALIARDRGRCRLCGTRAWLHIHHLERTAGDVDVLVLLCSVCHKRLVHGACVEVSGRAPDLEFRLADGTAARAGAGVT